MYPSTPLSMLNRSSKYLFVHEPEHKTGRAEESVGSEGVHKHTCVQCENESALQFEERTNTGSVPFLRVGL